MNLGTLKEITNLREIWPHEALNFTPWVAENVDLLAEAVGLEITVDETESSVGDFNVDIYASETGTDRKIIIENQLEDTDHDHLGKIITYASGKGADVIIVNKLPIIILNNLKEILIHNNNHNKIQILNNNHNNNLSILIHLIKTHNKCHKLINLNNMLT